MVIAIVAAEIAFWVVLALGLATRYGLRWEQTSIWILRSVVLVDLTLVTLVAIHVASGAEPELAHSIAAAYLGFTVAFGHSTIAAVDARFRHRFAGGPSPVKLTKGSRAQVRALWVEWRRVLLAASIAIALILVLLAVDGFPVPESLGAAADDPYWSVIGLLVVITSVWFLAGPAFAGRGHNETFEATQD